MASTILHSRGHRTSTAAAEPAATRVYERPVGTAFTGLAALLVGAWGALAGYIGPYFGFRPVAATTWVGNWQNGLLHLLPGAVAAAAGLMLLAMGPARRSVRGGAFMLPALLLVAAGAWFVIGPVAWPTFHSGPAFLPVTSASRNLLNVACSSYAPGLALAMLGGMALKAGLVPAVAVEDPYTPAEVAAPSTRPGAVAEPAMAAPVDREATAANATRESTVAEAPVTGRRGRRPWRTSSGVSEAERARMAEAEAGTRPTEGPDL